MSHRLTDEELELYVLEDVPVVEAIPVFERSVCTPSLDLTLRGMVEVSRGDLEELHIEIARLREIESLYMDLMRRFVRLEQAGRATVEALREMERILGTR